MQQLFRKRFYLKVGDTAPPLPIQIIREDNNSPLDLTGANATFVMKEHGSTTTKVNSSATIVDAVNGKIEYRWNSGDTDEAGVFRGVFKVTLSNGKVASFPVNGYFEIVILDQL